MRGQKRKKTHVDKENLVDLYNAIFESKSDIEIILGMVKNEEVTLDKAHEIIQNRMDIITDKMNKVWNYTIDVIKQKNQIYYATYKKFESTKEGIKYYEKYQKNKQLIEEIEQGIIDVNGIDIDEI